MDGWISQAKQLRTDIDDSKRLATEVKKHSQEAQKLQAEVQDTANKVDLLNDEVIFNEALTADLEQAYKIQKKINVVEGTSLEDGLEIAIISLQEAREQLSIMQETRHTRLAGLFEEKILALTKLAEGAVTERWESCFEIDTAVPSLTIHSEPHGKPSFPNIMADRY